MTALAGDCAVTGSFGVAGESGAGCALGACEFCCGLGSAGLAAEFGVAGVFAEAGVFAVAGELGVAGESGVDADADCVVSVTPVDGASEPFSTGAATAEPMPRPKALIAPTAIHFLRSGFMIFPFLPVPSAVSPGGGNPAFHQLDPLIGGVLPARFLGSERPRRE